MQSAPHSHSQALAGTTNVPAANAGTGIGAIVGGAVIPAFGLAKIACVAAAIAVPAVLVAPPTGRLRRS